MRHHRAFLLLVFSLLTPILACNLSLPAGNPSFEGTAVAATLGAGQTSTAAVLSAAATLAAAAIPPTAAATETPAASPTPSATLTPESTATPMATVTPSVPLASLTQNTNCRSGPLAVYDLIRTFLTGDSAQISGKDAAGDYWYVTDPNQPGKDCWLWGRYVTVSGDTSNIPVFTPPPTPTPSYVWTGHWNVWIDLNPASMTLVQSGNSVTGQLIATPSYDVSATTSDGGRRLSGSLTPFSPPLTFVFRMSSDMNQFTGHFTTGGNTYEWCGARNGAGEPSPCLGP